MYKEKEKEKKRKMVKKSRISGPDGMGHKNDGLVESNPKKKKVTVGKKKGYVVSNKLIQPFETKKETIHSVFLN